MDNNYLNKAYEYLNDLMENDRTEACKLWLDFCSDTGEYSDMVFENDENEINSILNGLSPFDVACKVAFGDYNPMHNWFKFNGYDNLVSSSYLPDLVSPDLNDQNFLEYVYANAIGESENYREDEEEE